MMKMVPWHIRIRINFRGKNSLCVKFSLRLIFVRQATWLFFVTLITRHRQIFVCFVGQAIYIYTHENFYRLRYILVFDMTPPMTFDTCMNACIHTCMHTCIHTHIIFIYMLQKQKTWVFLLW